MRQRPLFIVLYPFKFSDFVYDKMELPQTEEKCDVEIWDISYLINKEFSEKLVYKKSLRNNFHHISSWRQFIKRIKELKTANRKICIRNSVPEYIFQYLIIHLILFFYLRKKGLLMLNESIGSLPIENYIVQPENSFTDKLGKIYLKIRSAKFKVIFSLFFVKIFKYFLPEMTTHIMYAGSDWYQKALKMKGDKNIKLVPIHSYDYSNVLLYSSRLERENIIEKQITFLDCPTPMFVSDYDLLGHVIYNTVEVWYPSLSHFFEAVEIYTNAKVLIAGHYKTTHPSVAPYFGFRNVYYDKTIELVKECEAVITQFSSAISYAVIFKKPVIFIYSDELLEDKLSMDDTLYLSAKLGTKPININSFNLKDLDLTVNTDLYEKYKNRCLTSPEALDKPNHQILFKEILGI